MTATCTRNVFFFSLSRGKNVLNQKSELQRALEKHKDHQTRKEMENERNQNKSLLEKVIEERARRIESVSFFNFTYYVTWLSDVSHDVMTTVHFLTWSRSRTLRACVRCGIRSFLYQPTFYFKKMNFDIRFYKHVLFFLKNAVRK